MIEALLSFLGGSVFRMVWGEASAWLNRRQDHRHEMERLALQRDMDDRAHERSLEALRLQHDLGIQTVRVKADADVAVAEAGAFSRVMQAAFKPTGYTVVDVWNGVIRPAGATIALTLWVLKLQAQGWVMQDWDIALSATILGFFYADRSLHKRGK
jgi:hypothetical protein